MAERTEGTIQIAADPAAVMAVIADFDAYPEWSGDVKKVEVREKGADGRATQVSYEISAGPINASYTLAYTYAPGDAGCSWTLVEGSVVRALDGEYVLEAAGGSTTVTYRLAVDVALPGPGFLKRKLMGEGERRIVDTALKGLKARVEGLG